MTRSVLGAVILAGLLLAGCGGSSSSSSGGGGGTVTVDPSRTFVEAVLAPGGVVPTDPSAFIFQDALNIEVNQNVAFQLATYTTSGERRVLTVEGWRSSDTTNSFGTLAENSGLYLAGTSAMPSPGFIGVRFQGNEYFSSYRIRPRQATITGQIVSSGGGALRGTGIEFYDATQTVVGKVSQPFSGNFRASVPLNTESFLLLGETIPAGFRRVYVFNGKGYRAGDITCRVPIDSSLVLGNNNLASAITLVPNSEPEPDLDGCE